MYSVSRATIKDLLLQAPTMLLAAYVTCDYIPGIETPPTPEMRSPPHWTTHEYCLANGFAGIAWAVCDAESGGGGAWS